MFKDTTAFSGFSVDDIPAAKAFYLETLGLEVTEADGMLTLHLAGDRPTLVYPKPNHVPATYTILNFSVPDIEPSSLIFVRHIDPVVTFEPRTVVVPSFERDQE